jgi:hypothetical protein
LNYRQKAFQAQQHLVNVNLHPRISFFASAGIGYPNPFNFYDVGVSPFYILGAKANWRFWDWQSTARESQVLKIQEDVIENNKSNFNRSISLKLSRLRSDVEKYRKLMEYDLEIVTARERIRQLSSLRLDEGIILSSEFAEDVSAEKVARINLQIHRIKWIMAGINVMTEYGMEYK